MDGGQTRGRNLVFSNDEKGGSVDASEKINVECFDVILRFLISNS